MNNSHPQKCSWIIFTYTIILFNWKCSDIQYVMKGDKYIMNIDWMKIRICYWNGWIIFAQQLIKCFSKIHIQFAPKKNPLALLRCDIVNEEWKGWIITGAAFCNLIILPFIHIEIGRFFYLSLPLTVCVLAFKWQF